MRKDIEVQLRIIEHLSLKLAEEGSGRKFKIEEIL